MFLLIITYAIRMLMNMAVAETLKTLRMQKGISQEKLANAIDSHQVYISEIEKGKKMPSLTILYNIAKFFEMSLTELVSQIENNYNKLN